jgi:hypothetical protein
VNIDELNEKNFVLFCAQHYDSSHYASTEDFMEDLQRIKYIKKLITRYINNGDLKERLILNHIIILNNCFGPEVLCKILLLKLKEHMKYVKPFLVLLNVIPDTIYNVDGKAKIDTNLIDMDLNIVDILRKI